MLCKTAAALGAVRMPGAAITHAWASTEGSAGPPPVLPQMGRQWTSWHIWSLQHRGATSILEVVLCREHGEHQPFPSAKDALLPPRALGAQLVSGLDGFSVMGVRGQGHLALGRKISSWKGLSEAP